MKALLYAAAALLLCTQNYAHAQDKLNVKFGKIEPADFNLPDSAYLKGADAVYLFDIGKSEFNGNSKGWFTMEFKRHVRIKILTTGGFDAADFELELYKDGTDVEKLLDLKAITYNLDNGTITQAKLKDDDVFEDKQSKRVTVKKFTLPGVKVGSVIDVQYTIASDFFSNLQPWTFQGRYPRIWSEYEVLLPEFFNYVLLSQGYRSFHVNKTGESFKSYNVIQSEGAGASQFVNVDSRVFTHRWVMKDAPALKSEPFTTTLANHIAKVEFQLNRIQFPNNPPRNIMSTWPIVVDKLNADLRFGSYLYKGNNWLDDDLKPVLAGAATPTEKAQKIYAFVRDNFTCTADYARYLTEDNGNALKTVMKTKKGSVADINLLLVAMLQHEAIEAYPVLLSTRNHGVTHEFYPLMDRFNKTVVLAVVEGKSVYLDASDPMLGFDKLSPDCYNGHARVITGAGIPVYLEADSLMERKVTTVFLANTDKGQWEGTLNSTLGYYESLDLRQTIKAKGKEQQIKSMQNALGETTMLAPEFENLDDKDKCVTVSYKLQMARNDEDIIYFNPMLAEGYKENPFKSAERLYPVEMDYANEETYVLNVEIPAGYKVDDMPKSARVKLNDTDGMFEYLVGVQDDRLMLRSRLVIKRANFSADDYQTLRDFYGYVVKKQSEQVVFKKVTP